MVKVNEIKDIFIEKFIKIDKIDYKVPIFLADKLKNIPESKEFYTSYKSDNDEIPLWWKRNTNLPSSKRENKISIRRSKAIKKALVEQNRLLEEAKSYYLKALLKQEKEFQNSCQKLDKQVDIKIEELEKLRLHNKLVYENKLLQLEMQLQKANNDKEFFERENKKLCEIEKYEEDSLKKETNYQNSLASVDDELNYQIELNKQMSTKTFSHYKDSDKEKDQKLKFYQLTTKSVIEKYDKNNILEIKYFTLSHRDSGVHELYKINFDVKRKGKTFIYSQSNRILSNIISAIMRTYSSDFVISNGGIRINGKISTEILKEEYRKYINECITNANDVEDKFERYSSKRKKTIKEKCFDETMFLQLLKLLEINYKNVLTRIKELSAIEKYKLSVAYSLSQKKPLTIISDFYENISKEDKKLIIDLLNNFRIENAILFLTSDMELISSVKDISLFTFNI